MRLALSDSFIDALCKLEHVDARRASAFVDKLLTEPDTRGLHEEMVKDAHNRSVRSFHVTREMRAIGHIEGDTLVLLWVDRHDRAYAWARSRCIECAAHDAEILVSTAEKNAPPAPSSRACIVTSRAGLIEVLDRYGIAHALA